MSHLVLKMSHPKSPKRLGLSSVTEFRPIFRTVSGVSMKQGFAKRCRARWQGPTFFYGRVKGLILHCLAPVAHVLLCGCSTRPRGRPAHGALTHMTQVTRSTTPEQALVLRH